MRGVSMCRDLVVHLVWGDDAPEDAEDVFDPKFNYDALTENYHDELMQFMDDRFFGRIEFEVRPLS
jgi:hypothetical protein